MDPLRGSELADSAPSQRGARGPRCRVSLGPWTDESSLGVVAFHALTGNDHRSRGFRVTERWREANAGSAARNFKGVRDDELSGTLFVRSGQL